jgi:WD repeat-containing protein 68
MEEEQKRKEIYTYQAPWLTYSMSWCRRKEGKYKMAVGSYLEQYNNKFHIIQLQEHESGNGYFEKISEFDHPYPATKVMWAPSEYNLSNNTDLIATTGDYLRLWTHDLENTIELKGVLNNNKHAGKFDI